MLAVLTITATFAAASINKAVHIPRNGDCVDRWRCETLNPGGSGDSAVWDFSGATVVDENQRVRYIVLGDSLLVRYEGATMNTFLLKADSVLWKKRENRLSFMADSIAPLQMLLPMTYADSITTPFYMTGNYCGNNALTMAGYQTCHVDGRGTLILPGDTIADVLRLHIASRAKVRVSSGLDAQPLHAASDSVMDKNDDTYLWYSGSYRYPLAEVRMTNVSASDGTSHHSEASFLCPPSVQDYALGTNAGGKAQKQRSRKNSENSHDGSANSVIENLTLSHQGHDVEVSFMPGADGEASMVMTDIVGRVFSSMPKKTVSKGVPFTERIAVGQLPSGTYLLHVEMAGHTLNRKFTIQ